ncbi:UNVERIFIED_CONTAM: hypothetical protein Scaly_2499100 [Sesamum calycinum]|uniref:Chromo domain-containing protein n=1 Tax=Sesamum calycinum TaxID=2727403 RepID=A0AAW2LT88_9LAMI
MCQKGDLRKSLISECHDTLWAGHPGEQHTYALVQGAYYWPQMRDDVETYVRTCLICQQDKADHQKKAGLLQPLPEPFRLLGSKLSMSSSYHPQSDGQTEYFNYMLEEYLRHFVRGTQNDWVKLLDVAQLCFNVQKSSSTNKSAFEIVPGQQPLLPHTLDSPHGVRSSLARSFSQEWKQNVGIARSFLEKAQKWMKKYADNNRRFVEFNAGDLVMVKVPDPRLSKSLKGKDPRLMQKYVGPLPIIKHIGTVAYKIELPSWWKIHSLFHVSQLKKYSADKEDDARNQPSRPQLELTKTKEKVAEAILNHRVMSTAKRNHNEYLVKWKGCSNKENTWEWVTNLKAFLSLVEAYHTSHAPRTSPSQEWVNSHFLKSTQLCTLDTSISHHPSGVPLGGTLALGVAPAASVVDTSGTPDLAFPHPHPTTPAPIEIMTGETHTSNETQDAPDRSLSVNIDAGDRATTDPPTTTEPNAGPSGSKK